MEDTLKLILEEVQSLKADVQGVKEDVQSVKADVQSVKDDVQSVKEDVQSVKDDVQKVKDDVQDLKKEVSKNTTNIKSLELTLENTTNVNIMRVAEGHLDLSRKLNESLKISNEQEINAIKIRIMEDDIRKIKEHLDIA